MKRVSFIIACAAMLTMATGAFAADPPKPTTLRVMLSGAGKERGSDAVIEAFNKQLKDIIPNVSVEIERIPETQFEDKLRLTVFSGEAVDVANLNNGASTAKNTLTVEARKKMMLPLNDLISKHAPAIKSDIPPGVLKVGSVDGKIYAVPLFLFKWSISL